MCFSHMILSSGFSQSHGNNTLFIKQSGFSFIPLLIHVDNILIASNSDADLQALKFVMHKAFVIKICDNQSFLGLKIERNASEISVCHKKYALGIMEATCMLACKPSSIFMDPIGKLTRKSETSLVNIAQYRELIGRLCI